MRSTDESGNDSDLQWPLHTASTVKDHGHGGVIPNLASVLASHPGLENHRTVVLNLAYEEYRLRLKAGESLDAREFSRRFPSLERSLHFFILVNSRADDNPDLAGLQGAAPWPEPGCRFLGFDLISELGRGAMGQVFLASERALGERRVALKVALQGGYEAEILGRLRHVNIVPVYSIQEDDATGLTAFCMPYLGRATLATVLDGVYAKHHPPLRAETILHAVRAANEGLDLPGLPLPDRILRNGSYVEGVIHLGAQLAEALAHAHAQGIFHRDLKPSNILMAPDGRPLLLDFSLSVDDYHPVGMIGGTLPYMAPEELSVICQGQTCGRSPGYARRSDLFSLGVILYELLAGGLPFGAIPCKLPLKEIAARLRQRQAEGPRPLSQRNSRVGKQLARLIERCLAFDPQLRPENADVLAAALRKELTLWRRSGRWLVAHRRSALVAASIAMLMALGVTAFFMLRPPYGVRQFQQGLACYKAGRDDLALACLDASLRTDPRSSEALAARARVHQRQGNFQLALADYDAADRLLPSPRFDACKGYCLSRLFQDREAAAFFRRSLEAGCDSPAVLNDLGYSWLRLGRLENAEDCLRRAIQADDTLQAAHHNLVLVFLQRAYEGKTVPPEAFVHARRALETGPESGELCRNLALLHALAAKQDAAFAQPAIAYVAKAVAHGMDAGTLRSDPAFSALEKDPAFQAALAARGALQESPEAVRLVDPGE